MIYNIVLESSIGVGTSNNTRSFYIDWGRIPESAYKVTFCFNSATVATAYTGIANVLVDIGQTQNIIVGSTNASYKNNYLGTLSGSPANFSSIVSTNPPVYISCRPKNNNITVQLVTPAFAPFDTTIPDMGVYTLVLSFEKLN